VTPTGATPHKAASPALLPRRGGGAGDGCKRQLGYRRPYIHPPKLLTPTARPLHSAGEGRLHRVLTLAGARPRPSPLRGDPRTASAVNSTRRVPGRSAHVSPNPTSLAPIEPPPREDAELTAARADQRNRRPGTTSLRTAQKTRAHILGPEASSRSLKELRP